MNSVAKVKISEFEEQVFELEEVRIVVRAPRGGMVDAYSYEKKASKTQQINDWLDMRVRPKIGDFEVVIVSGQGLHPHGRTKMDTLRDSYAE
jgi:hypothetical protein